LALEAVHARPHFGFVLQGRFAVRGDRSEEEVVAGSLRFSPHVETLRLEIPGGFEALVGELDGAGTLPRGEGACIGADVPAIGLLRRVAADATHPALVELERWALAARCRAVASSRVARWPEDLVIELGTAPLGARVVRSWSEHAGRHRSTLHRSFRRSLGLDPSGWILRERLRRAWGLLETEQPLVEIALDCGFADQSHMSRVFRRFTGWTPGALRTERRRAAARMRPGSKTAQAS
jgi:AraC-like DNA-binding protein